MSARSRLYQAQITGKTNLAYVVNGVKFDGIAKGVLIEAKGLGYRNFIKDGQFRGWFHKGTNALVDQAKRQIVAARGMPIQWHVAEKEFADALRELFHGQSGISIIFSPVR